MASATLTHEIDTALVPPTQKTACWWRQGHSYAFIAVAIAEVIVTWGVVRLVEHGRNVPSGLEEIVYAALIGFLFAQCFLLGLWAALGGLGTVARWLVVGAVATLGAMAVAFELISPQWQDFLYQGPIIAVLALLMIAGIAVVLLPLRRLAGWRIDFDAAYHPNKGRRRGQLDLMDFAALFCAVALPLTLGRALVELMGNDAAGIGVIVPIFSALVLLTAGPAAYAALARRATWLWIVGCVAWLALVSIVQTVLAGNFPDLDVFDGSGSAYALGLTVAAFHLSVAATVAAPLLALRCFGLNLITVS